MALYKEDQWVMGDKFRSGNFLNAINNRVESLNGKLKSVIDHNSSLETFIEGLFCVVNVLRNEKHHKAVVSVQKRRVHTYPVVSDECRYIDLLTSYASEYVVKQISLSRSNDYVFTPKSNGKYNVKTSQGESNLDINTCSCYFLCQ